MSSSVFPDINVWLALTLLTHEHHKQAWRWYESLPQAADLVFCRFTQLGLLRLLTTKSIAIHATMTHAEAWNSFDAWLEEGGGTFQVEPLDIEAEFRSLSSQKASSPKEWADSYLAAFATTAALTLITFDKALAGRTRGALLLRSTP